MDDLRERLKRIRHLTGLEPGQGGVPEKTVNRRNPRVSSIRDQLERLDRRGSGRARGRGGIPGSSKALEEVLNGREEDTPAGPCYEIKSSYRPAYRHGKYCLDEFARVDLKSMDVFCRGEGFPDIRPEEILFLDLETTGLSQGTGTYAFLVGMGYFREGKYHIHQLFLRNFQEEPAFLFHTLRTLEPFRFLVTFNGKRFDIPLLETRFTLFSMDSCLRERVEWDLLYPSRRLWKERLEDCRLETLEKMRLDVAREDRDIRGDQIPEIYYRYVHEGDARDLDRIVYHNAMDVLSLTSLVIHLDKSLKEKDPSHVNLLSMGRYFERKGKQEMGRKCYEIASGRGYTQRERNTALFRLALQKKREGEIEAAVSMWKELILDDSEQILECCVELAKYYEHKAKDLDQAMETVEYALVREGEKDFGAQLLLKKRLERLMKKRG